MKTPNDPRHQTRKLALSLIYSRESFLREKNSPKFKLEDTKKASIHNLNITNYNKAFLDEIVKGVEQNNEKLKEIISKNSNDWEINQMYLIDLSILLMATWEIYYKDTPQKVVVDEAVELAKEFGDNESSKFINGILAGIIQDFNNSKNNISET